MPRGSWTPFREQGRLPYAQHIWDSEEQDLRLIRFSYGSVPSSFGSSHRQPLRTPEVSARSLRWRPRSSGAPAVDPPPIHNIERWWNDEELRFLCRLKACILDTSEEGSDERDLLLVAFCRVVITLSNAAFNHQSMSFKETNKSPTLFELQRNNAGIFRKELSLVLNGAADNPRIEPTVVTGDARQPSRFLHDKFDMLITSPPYPNRMSYIRELRPYMYWLDLLTNGRDAGEHDWQAIGGTWGVATSRLATWEPSGKAFTPTILKKSLAGISDPKNDNGKLLANYVAKYFEDMWNHISDISAILKSGFRSSLYCRQFNLLRNVASRGGNLQSYAPRSRIP